MTNWRWWLCSLLFVATTVNYLDRQVLSLTYEEFIKPEFHWTDANYGTITSFFSIFYAICCLFAGKFVDWMGTKKGYLIAIGVWSAGACLHAATGWATAHLTGLGSVAALRAVEVGSNAALPISTTGVYLFLLCRGILALGEAGNFPAAIKVTAEYFPKKDRAFATSIFNAGASVGALAAPLTIPPLALKLGWEWAFIIIGALGFVWMFFWAFMYDKPESSKHVNEAELEYIHQDDAAEAAEKAAGKKAPVAPDAAPIEHRRFTKEERIRAFAEDRVYDDVPTGTKRFDAGSVGDMGRVRDILVMENPREYVSGPRDQVSGGLDFGNIGMEHLEGPGYSAIVKREPDEDRIPSIPSEPPKAVVGGFKLDLGGPISNQLDAINAVRREAPMQPVMEDDDAGQRATVEMNSAQKQMLAAMRAQRSNMRF